MAKVYTHIMDCKELLSEGFEYVHQWMDFYEKKYPYQIHFNYHRKFRHNIKGLREIHETWGDEALLAGRIHLVRDDEQYLLNKAFREYKFSEIHNIFIKNYEMWEIIE